MVIVVLVLVCVCMCVVPSSSPALPPSKARKFSSFQPLIHKGTLDRVLNETSAGLISAACTVASVCFGKCLCLHLLWGWIQGQSALRSFSCNYPVIRS